MLRLEYPRLSLLECLIFGSTLSATDPVTILSIFNSYKVDPQLYSIIFGESILNDAVSIVMFETLSRFRDMDLSVWSIFPGTGFFLVVFSLSTVLGVVYGLGCSLLLKHSQLGRFPELESCVVMLIAYTSYFFSNTVEMSGIVSRLFCGITMKHYAYHNMSLRTQRTTKYIFQTLASVCVVQSMLTTAVRKLYFYLSWPKLVHGRRPCVPSASYCLFASRRRCVALLLRVPDCVDIK